MPTDDPSTRSCCSSYLYKPIGKQSHSSCRASPPCARVWLPRRTTTCSTYKPPCTHRLTSRVLSLSGARMAVPLFVEAERSTSARWTPGSYCTVILFGPVPAGNSTAAAAAVQPPCCCLTFVRWVYVRGLPRWACRACPRVWHRNGGTPTDTTKEHGMSHPSRCPP